MGCEPEPLSGRPCGSPGCAVSADPQLPCCPPAPLTSADGERRRPMRIVGLDVHRVFAEAVMLDEGKVVRPGRVGMTREPLDAFARAVLTHDDRVVVEATGNGTAVAEVLAPHVGRVVIANPRQVRLIAEARIKTDVIDATVLARLYASGFLPEVWVPDARTEALRRQVTRRMQIVRRRARLKTMAQSILHAHLA